jgi:hypothetical protein
MAGWAIAWVRAPVSYPVAPLLKKLGIRGVLDIYHPPWHPHPLVNVL